MEYNYTMLHCHTMYGNGSFIDSTATYEQYIDRAKELGMSAIAITEHGMVVSWYKKKTYCESQGLKYIHAQEFYVTETLNEKVRDNYHCCLYAKNFEGFKELNKLSSKSFNRKEENRFYYNPRITFDELTSTSDNIIITTACLGGILAKGNYNIKSKFIDFLIVNNHRCFLEVQPHNVLSQKEYNSYLSKLSKHTGLKLIVGTDTHCLNSMDSRSVLQKSKNINFEDEEGWDLTFRSYTEIEKMFLVQGILSHDEYHLALENTNVLASMIEEFELDYSNKYPIIYDNPENIVQQKITEGLQYRKVKYEDVQERIEYELDVYKKNGALQFILLDDMWKEFCRKNNIRYGPGRGSVTGSFIAYLMRLTDINPIKWNLSFERFMSPERVSLADVDSDIEPNKRDIVKDFWFNQDKINCSEIMTCNTIAIKGAIRDVGRALNYDLSLVNEISNSLDSNEERYRKKYPELFRYVDELNGTMVSIGAHPCGLLVYQGDIEEMVGTFTTSTSNYPISQIDMKEIDKQNYVKLDLLGLDNIQLISDTCNSIGIDWITPDTIDYNDKKVWDSIRKNSCMIFQMESPFAFEMYKKTFSDSTLSKIMSSSANITYIDLLSMVNGAIRPSGESFRDKMANGEYNDNGHVALNEFLSDTLGFLTYQEQILEFLHKFCGYTKGKADIVRRGFAKKTGTEQFLPEIKSGFIKTMKEVYNEPEDSSEKLIEAFLEIIGNASMYGFSKNHSHSYSFIGYICAWLRYYYPLEFISSALNIYKNDEDKTAKIVEYANLVSIRISSAKFGYSKGEYVSNKSTNSIYKGIGSIKFCNTEIGEELYAIKNNQYSTFIDFLLVLTQTSINSRQLDILIKLDYFSPEFGNAHELTEIVKYFEFFKKGSAKTIDKSKISGIIEDIVARYSTETAKQYKLKDTIAILKEIETYIKSQKLQDYTLKGKAIWQLEYLGYVDVSTGKSEDRNKLFVLDIQPLKTKAENKIWAWKVKTCSIGRCKKSEITILDRNYLQILEKYDIIYVADKDVKVVEKNGFRNIYCSHYVPLS